MDKIVEIDHITMKYQAPNGEIEAIADVSFSIENGEFVSLVGPSGCGKTTLLSAVAGLFTPSNGEIRIKGQRITQTSPHIGYMLQKDHLFDWRTIWQNVLIGLEVRHLKTPENLDYINGLLDTYGLHEFKDKYPDQLSGGMRQRVALIRTLATRPEILLLDEPFSALDYQTRLAVSEDIYSILKSERKTALMVTHDIAEGISMSDRIVVLSERPAHIVAVHDIVFADLAPRTPLSCREAPEFRQYFNIIWKELGVRV